MRLRSFRVCGFRCIKDSGHISVKDLVALVGRNESGKTALLQALVLLNKDSVVQNEDLTDGLEAEQLGEQVSHLLLKESLNLQNRSVKQYPNDFLRFPK